MRIGGAITCGPHSFQCHNGTCIESSLKCDGEVHCADGSDELDCVSGVLLITLSTIIVIECHPFYNNIVLLYWMSYINTVSLPVAIFIAIYFRVFSSSFIIFYA